MAVVGFSTRSAVVRGRVHQGPALPRSRVVPGCAVSGAGSPASSRRAVALLAVSVLVSPGAWQDWFDFLREQRRRLLRAWSTCPPWPSPSPWWSGFPLALVLVVVAARTDRPWLVPVAMVLASPVVGWGTFALLAAIPRLRGLRPARRAHDGRRRRVDADGRSLTP